jgi:hypothetical protein
MNPPLALTTWESVLLVELTVLQLLKKKIPRLVETEG